MEIIEGLFENRGKVRDESLDANCQLAAMADWQCAFTAIFTLERENHNFEKLKWKD